MTDKQRLKSKQGCATGLAWLIACLFFFPIFWMVLTGFKTEQQAVSIPPLLFFTPTLENYVLASERTGYTLYALNSVITAIGGTALGMLLAIPAAYAMAFQPGPRTRGVLLWMLSTK